MSNTYGLLGLLLQLAVCAIPTPCYADQPQKEADNSNIIQKIKADKDGVGLFALPVTVNNKVYHFLIDTASKPVLYDVSFRPMLGKPLKKAKFDTNAGVVELTAYAAPDSFVGQISLKTTDEVVVADLAKMREWSGVDYYGIIGMSFLKNHIVKIDFDNGEVFFLKSLEKSPGQAVPLGYQGGGIYTEVSIPGLERKERFDIGTGIETNVSGFISNKCINMLAKRGIGTHLTSKQTSLSLSGSTEYADFRLNAFSLGPFTLRNPIFSTSRKSTNELGLGYLSRFVVTFDFPHKVMYLKKGRMYDLPDGKDRSGLSIVRHGGKTVVTDVKMFSPAWWKGIRPKDELLGIDGFRADQNSLYSLRRLLGLQEKKVNLVLHRGEERIEVSLNPK